jgi:hypothetical protein
MPTALERELALERDSPGTLILARDYRAVQDSYFNDEEDETTETSYHPYYGPKPDPEKPALIEVCPEKPVVDPEQKEKQVQRNHIAERRRQLKHFFKENGFKRDAGVNDSKRVMLLCGAKSYPLHAAVEKNNLRVVEMLLAEGANPTQTNSSGRTPLQIAQRKNKKGSHETMLQILEAACDVPADTAAARGA